MATVIDADTHVIESERVWDFFDEELAHRKPQLVPCADPNTGNVRNFWIIDSKLVPHPPGKGGQALATPPVDDEIRGSTAWRKRAMTDVDARLDDATDMGVDVQVVYPTLFIGFLTHDVELEVALARSYNRFMADACSRSGGGACGGWRSRPSGTSTRRWRSCTSARRTARAACSSGASRRTVRSRSRTSSPSTRRRSAWTSPSASTRGPVRQCSRSSSTAA